MSDDVAPIVLAARLDEPPPAPLATAGRAAQSAAAARVFTTYRKRLAPNTRRRHDNDLERFRQFLADAGVTAGALAEAATAWQGVTWGLVEGFVEWQLQQGYAIASVNAALSTVRTYAGLAAKAGALGADELLLIKGVEGFGGGQARHVDSARETTRVGAKKAQPTHISDDQAAQLKRAGDARDQLLMALLLDHGLRIGEVEDLTVEGVDLAAGTFRFFREKVNLTQTHRLSPDALAAARVYLAAAPASAGPLLRTARGTKWADRNMRQRVAELGAGIGLASLSPHDCRHWWATAAIAGGTDIKSLQDAGGWASPAMPLRYAESASVANEGVKLRGR